MARSSFRWAGSSRFHSINGVPRTPSPTTVAQPPDRRLGGGVHRVTSSAGADTSSGGPEPTRERNMSLLVVEIVLAFVALQRGWRAAPLLLVGAPLAVLAFESTASLFFAPWVGSYFDPAGVARALAHGLSLVGLLVACWAGPAERPARARAGARLPRAGSLYQI